MVRSLSGLRCLTKAYDLTFFVSLFKRILQIDMVAFDLCPTAHGYFSIGCPITPGDADLSAVLKFPAEMSAGDCMVFKHKCDICICI